MRLEHTAVKTDRDGSRPPQPPPSSTHVCLLLFAGLSVLDRLVLVWRDEEAVNEPPRRVSICVS